GAHRTPVETGGRGRSVRPRHRRPEKLGGPRPRGVESRPLDRPGKRPPWTRCQSAFPSAESRPSCDHSSSAVGVQAGAGTPPDPLDGERPAPGVVGGGAAGARRGRLLRALLRRLAQQPPALPARRPAPVPPRAPERRLVSPRDLPVSRALL